MDKAELMKWERLINWEADQRHWLASRLWNGKLTQDEFVAQTWELETVKIPAKRRQFAGGSLCHTWH